MLNVIVASGAKVNSFLLNRGSKNKQGISIPKEHLILAYITKAMKDW